MHKVTVPSESTYRPHETDPIDAQTRDDIQFWNDSSPRAGLRFRPFQALAERLPRVAGQESG